MSNTENITLNPTLIALQNLIDVVAKLRSPEGGCPWDLEQTPETLVPYIIEEAYEVVDAIRSGDQNAIADELGDLLLQVILQAQIAGESNQFSLEEIANNITEKLIRRHPHVFGAVEVNSVEEVRQNWEEIKSNERGETPETKTFSSKLSRYARQLPPLIAGMKISQKAASIGFEWDNIEGVWDKFEEEVAEFKEAIQGSDKEHQQAELGDILFVLINLARWYNLDPHIGLQETNHRFIKRLSKVEEYCDRPLSEYSLEELDALWQQAKAILAQK
ncbi:MULTISPECIES: nucleoside triphosphate pyrophosphohydrolase [Planktothrix]|jgi:XTP/dITP diphosphohydrolase|uniref:Nucleoside triphosphate pyrophosphohydrolase n=3 Tax=Planktothrix TaxID=54304 RepID=A0A1J1JB83_PLAAG|nr:MULTISPECIES: nucleoside triphosphate pyrophosphohydrolase [Planktothrix]MCB8750982.1 nucleoside triphosphate pyrophosphohydrolase [Planktothrix agardhii 1810]MCB8759719.1 nucleoside triphosphate pyrophosphohydrolase [Planktothrix agardhii 1813]MCB8764520.1 nucleoside triphosphate pyrophosphohydrolase [Planktothrix agardhii 1809]MCB8766202.1 nucleoside triphosphate pyrophosphohydrolase [Planktothrix agardhii 1809]MCB8778176.1 nucleoside triphosphate pyrophosphohydrolase [Planktothrix agardh